jgi:hypothetical protein
MTRVKVANHNAAYLAVWNEKSRLGIQAKNLGHKSSARVASSIISESISFSEMAGLSKLF